MLLEETAPDDIPVLLPAIERVDARVHDDESFPVAHERRNGLLLLSRHGIRESVGRPLQYGARRTVVLVGGRDAQRRVVEKEDVILLQVSRVECRGILGEVGLPIQRDGKVLPCGIYGRWES